MNRASRTAVTRSSCAVDPTSSAGCYGHYLARCPHYDPTQQVTPEIDATLRWKQEFVMRNEV